MLRDGSGNPPDIRISAATNTPAHPPPKNAANNHQAETIGLLLLSPGLVACQDKGALATLRSYVWDRVISLSPIKPTTH
jgi:hypothetical protein